MPKWLNRLIAFLVLPGLHSRSPPRMQHCGMVYQIAATAHTVTHLCLQILLETCHGINLVKVEYVVKQMWAKSATITTPLSITMGASPAVVSASPPLAKTIKENMEGASAAHVKTAEVPGSTGAQSYHPPIGMPIYQPNMLHS